MSNWLSITISFQSTIGFIVVLSNNEESVFWMHGGLRSNHRRTRKARLPSRSK